MIDNILKCCNRVLRSKTFNGYDTYIDFTGKSKDDRESREAQVRFKEELESNYSLWYKEKKISMMAILTI